jgi:hypothetical protein
MGTYLQWFIASPSNERLIGVDWGGGSVSFLYNHGATPQREVNAKSNFTFTSSPLAETHGDFGDHSDPTLGYVWLQRLGFRYMSSEFPGFQARTLETPFWALVILPFFLGMPALLGWRTRRRRQLRGQCLNCGYDLRASVNRCPECATRMTIEPIAAKYRGRLAAALMTASVVVVGLCWHRGYASGGHDAAVVANAARTAEDAHEATERINIPPRADRAAWEQERAAVDAERRHFFSLGFVRLSRRTPESTGMGPNAVLWSDVQFQLTNRSGRDIDASAGVIEFYGPDGRLLGSTGFGIGVPMAPGRSCAGSFSSALDATTRSALAAGNVVARYRAGFVRYPNGTTKTFGEDPWEGAFVSAANAK